MWKLVVCVISARACCPQVHWHHPFLACLQVVIDLWHQSAPIIYRSTVMSDISLTSVIHVTNSTNLTILKVLGFSVGRLAHQLYTGNVWQLILLQFFDVGCLTPQLVIGNVWKLSSLQFFIYCDAWVLSSSRFRVQSKQHPISFQDPGTHCPVSWFPSHMVKRSRWVLSMLINFSWLSWMLPRQCEEGMQKSLFCYCR